MEQPATLYHVLPTNSDNKFIFNISGMQESSCQETGHFIVDCDDCSRLYLCISYLLCCCQAIHQGDSFVTSMSVPVTRQHASYLYILYTHFKQVTHPIKLADTTILLLIGLLV